MNGAASAKPANNQFRELLFRLGIVMLLLASIGLVWWSFGRMLAPRVKQSRELTAGLARLSTEVDDLDRQWPPADITLVTNQYALVPSHLFSDQMALDLWLTGLTNQVSSLAMAVRADYGKTITQVQGGEKFGIIPTSSSLDITNGMGTDGVASPYQRLLHLIQTVSAQEKRADLTELSVEGGSNSIYHATLGYNFWTTGEAVP